MIKQTENNKLIELGPFKEYCFEFNFRKFAFEKKVVYNLGDFSYGETLIYRNGIPEYYFNIFDTDSYGKSVEEFRNLVKKKSLDYFSIIDILSKKLDQKVTTKLSFWSLLSAKIDKDIEEYIEVKLYPFDVVWNKLSDNEKQALK